MHSEEAAWQKRNGFGTGGWMPVISERSRWTALCGASRSGWQLVPAEFWEDWSLAERREIAADIAAHMGRDQSAFGAFSDGRLVGFVTVSHRLFGVSARYAELVCFQVSEPYRGRGIGRRLFGMAVAEMEIIGAERLYISSFCAEETQAVYRALGCRPASEINAELAREEPMDVPLEYVPQSGKKI